MSDTIMQTIPFEAFKNVGGSPATTIGAVILNSRSTAY